jgi:transposase/transposase-like protein
MTQHDRDRLVVLKKAQKKLITQSQAAKELDISSRQVRRLLRALKVKGDKAVIHGLCGRASQRKLSAAKREQIVSILAQEVYRGFGPTLASEYLRAKHQVKIGREALRQIMIVAGLWRARRQKVERVHQWRPRRSCLGELVQWDTSEHDWLEGRGDKLYLIHMIDDATSTLSARFVRHDSTVENMRLLWSYLERHGRPAAFYTDKASLFQTAPKVGRNQAELARDERDPLPPTQIGRALRELGIVWLAAHSPQAKGRVERSFGTAQDRLVKGLRVAGARTLEEANQYLEEHFLAWWNQHLVTVPANAADAHRPLGPDHDLAATLSHVESRQVTNDYTFPLDAKRYRIIAQPMPAGLRHSIVRVETRLDGTVTARFRERYLCLEECPTPPKAAAPPPPKPPIRSRRPTRPGEASRAGMDYLLKKPALPVWKAAAIDRTRTPDRLD